MDIEKLGWDSEFFNYPIGRLDITEETLDQLPALKKLGIQEGYRLMYFMLRDVEKYSAEFINKVLVKTASLDAALVDKKVFAQLEIQDYSVGLPLNVTAFRPGMDEEKMIDLALQCGEYSRFRNDKGFNNHEFERMYTYWIRSFLQGGVAGQVFVSTLDHAYTGLVAVSNKTDHVSIDLIGIDRPERGKGIAKTLLDATIYYAGVNDLGRIRLSTQADNVPAMNFYARHGFDIYRVDYIFHAWL